MPPPPIPGPSIWGVGRRLLGISPGAGVLFGVQARRRLALGMVGSVVIAAVEVASVTAILPLMQLLTGASIDQGILGSISGRMGITDTGTLAIVLAVGVLTGFLAKGLLTLAFKWWLMGVLMRQQVDTSREILTYFLVGPHSLHQERRTGELIRNAGEAVSRAYATVAMGSISIVTEAVTISAVVGLLIVIMPVPTLAVVAYFGLAAWAFMRLSQPRLKRTGDVIMDSSVEVFAAAVNALGGVKEIKLRSNYEYFLRRFSSAKLSMARAERTAMFLSDLPRYAMEILFIFGLGVLVATVFATNSTGAALSMVAVFAAAGYRILPSLVRLIASVGHMRSGDKALREVVGDLSAARDWGRVDCPSADGPTLRNQLELRSVTFTYPGGNRPVLDGVTLTVPRGSSVALVGGSGAGKSTLVDLVLGLQEPSSGMILVDGVDIRDNVAAWRSRIGLVPQEVFFTDGTLCENIAFGVEAADVDGDALEEAVRQAELTEFVWSLENGIETPIGERGARLSGGQRQRIGIARALYARPDLLVLDEATSALDNITERRITETIQGLAGELTMIVVAHRLSTVRSCDQLVLLRDGRVAATGTFEEVAAADREFAHMVALGTLAPVEPEHARAE